MLRASARLRRCYWPYCGTDIELPSKTGISRAAPGMGQGHIVPSFAGVPLIAKFARQGLRDMANLEIGTPARDRRG